MAEDHFCFQMQSNESSFVFQGLSGFLRMESRTFLCGVRGLQGGNIPVLSYSKQTSPPPLSCCLLYAIFTPVSVQALTGQEG